MDQEVLEEGTRKNSRRNKIRIPTIIDANIKLN